MKYQTKNNQEAVEAKAYLKVLLDKKCLVEIKKVSPRRSLKQNNYLYLTFGIFAAQTGYKPEEAKVIYKRYANTSLYVYEKNGIAFLRSSADLSTEEMTRSIDRWREYAAENGVNIPPPTDEEALRFYENMIEQQQHYM